MTKFLIFILVAVVGSLGVFYYQKTEICRNPLGYDTGRLDPRFNISTENLVFIVREAETVWENGIGQELFEHRPGAKFKINLVFDERQKETVEAAESKEGIDVSGASYRSAVARYKSLSESYEKETAQHKNMVLLFESQLNDYNRLVSEINFQGGATQQEFKQLDLERKSLEEKKKDLDKQAGDLNKKAVTLNLLGEEINNMAKVLNLSVDIYNKKFGEAREFDQGEYFGDKINIYQFDSNSDLRLVLTHELGHALGLDHVGNPKSIMYHLMEQQDLVNFSLSVEDRLAFKKLCSFPGI